MELHKMEEYFSQVGSGRCRMNQQEAGQAFPRRGSIVADPSTLDERAIEYAQARGLVCGMLPQGGYEFTKPKLKL